MKLESRRKFLEYSATALATVRSSFGSSLDAIGVQLYTVRKLLGSRPGATLRALDQIGYAEAEVVWTSMDAIWNDLKKTRLKPISVHLDSALFSSENTAKLTAAISHCKELGFRYVVYPYTAPNQRGGLDSFRSLADVLNRAGEACRKVDLELCYHNHGFEFQPMGNTTGMETLLSRTDKALVGWEMDIFWVSVAGFHPSDLLKQYAGRVPLMHLKNKAEGIPVRYDESLPPSAFREVGDGVLRIPIILRDGEAAGVQHFFVEQDETPGDPIDSLRRSYRYLRDLKRS
ncbi:MAG TPA: sugar phosphate isomerase/epimerase [Bryobacteraceae bacterium]|jgi:sugar phosphate isomerase/epimerase|nr:sugar phosphate isomerase/epimerase [Bryobacteraceae bacterium]